jgi:hypothetical protein
MLILTRVEWSLSIYRSFAFVLFECFKAIEMLNPLPLSPKSVMLTSRRFVFTGTFGAAMNVASSGKAPIYTRKAGPLLIVICIKSKLLMHRSGVIRHDPVGELTVNRADSPQERHQSKKQHIRVRFML